MKVQIAVFLGLISLPAWGQGVVAAARSDLRNLVDQTDELIGGDRSDDIRSGSTLRFTLNDQTSRFGGRENPGFHTSFSLKLGKLESWSDDATHWLDKRWKRLKSDVTGVTTEGDPDKEQGPHPKGRPLEVHPDPDAWHFTLEKHLSVTRHPTYGALERVRKDFESGPFLHSFAVSAGWRSDSLWQANAELSNHKKIASRLTLNFINSAQWSISNQVVDAAHGPGLTLLLTDRQVVSLNLVMNTQDNGRGWSTSAYSISSFYRISAWNNWIYFSLNPSITYERTRNFRDNPGAGASLQFVL